jgi:CBS domain-containing protein
MSTLDPVGYVRALRPFDALPAPLFEEVARGLEIALHPAGQVLARAGGEPLGHLYLIRRGAVRLGREGQTLQVLEEGEAFGYTSLLSGEASLDVTVDEDLLAYRLPGDRFGRLLLDAAFAGHFAVGLSGRLRSSLERAPAAALRPDLTLVVGDLLRRPAVWVEPGATVGEAARVMRDERVSSVLVRSTPPALLTERALRDLVLAESLGPETPAARVAEGPLRPVDAAVPIAEAWASLLASGARHLPVLRGGEVAGVISAADLLKCQATGPLAVLRRVERLADRARLPGYGAKVVEMASALSAGGLEATAIAGYVARLNDMLVRRVLALAEADLGPPPAPYAWLALGSEGRMEQTLLTDQDNALVYADEAADQRGWFQALAERVNADLAAAGFPECRGGYMARRWHGTASEWVQRFAGWFEVREPQALLEASIFFDFRRVAGALDVEPLEAAVMNTARHPVFLRYLARAALELRPPGSLALRLRAAAPVDLKLQGLAPVVYLARCYALEVGSRARSTRERLGAAVAAGLMGEEVFTTVSEAYRYLLGLRLRLQLRRSAEGRAVGNEVELPALSPAERSHLKEAFRAIKAWQEKAAYHYQAGF